MLTDACIYQCAMPLYQDVLTGREKGVLKHQVQEMTSQHKFQESALPVMFQPTCELIAHIFQCNTST